MFASVVIPTYKREQQLVDTIEYILADRYSEFEVIVVDQTKNHTPQVADAIETFQQDSRFRYVQIPIANLPLARNVGLRLAQGDVIIYVDDDVKLEPSFIAAHVACYEDTKIGAVGGRILNVQGRASDPTGSAKPGQILPDGTRTTHFYKTERAYIDWGMGCNMSFRRSALEDINGFDERYTKAAKHEDIDAFVRIRKAGYLAVFEPSACLTHLKTSQGGCRSETEEIERARSYLRSEALFYMVCGNNILRTIKRGIHGSLFHADRILNSNQRLKTNKQTLTIKLFLSYTKAIYDYIFKSSNVLSIKLKNMGVKNE